MHNIAKYFAGKEYLVAHIIFMWNNLKFEVKKNFSDKYPMMEQNINLICKLIKVLTLLYHQVKTQVLIKGNNCIIQNAA